MTIIDKFFKTNQSQSQSDYNRELVSLFRSYLINTYSNYIDDGNELLKFDFTTMAKTSQPRTFSDFCKAIKSGEISLDSSKSDTEYIQTAVAGNILSGINVDADYFQKCCDKISTVYESSLARSEYLQKYYEPEGYSPDNFELDVNNVSSCIADVENQVDYPIVSFSRNGNITLGNAYEVIRDLNAEDSEIVPWSLSIIKTATNSATGLMVKNHIDFASQQTSCEVPVEQ